MVKFTQNDNTKFEEFVTFQTQWSTLVSLILPSVLPTIATIVLDICNYTIARDSIEAPLGTTSRSLAREEERRRREEIPRRATVISTFTGVIPYILCGAIMQDLILPGLETRCLVMTITFSLVIALRNQIIAKYVCKINRQIQRQTVEDRRQQEIDAAIERRDKRKIVSQDQTNEEEDPVTHWIWNQNETLGSFER